MKEKIKNLKKNETFRLVTGLIYRDWKSAMIGTGIGYSMVKVNEKLFKDDKKRLIMNFAGCIAAIPIGYVIGKTEMDDLYREIKDLELQNELDDAIESKKN